MTPLQQDEALPVPPDRRIAAIDVLRGAALFGVLSVNLINEFRVSLFQQFLPAPLGGSRLDHAVQVLVSDGMELKAFALFSMLFGVGVAIQFERLAGNVKRLPLLVRRLLILLGLGLLHLCFIWNGDILTEYALIGLLALPFLYASNRVIAAVGLMALGVYAALPFRLPGAFSWPGEAWLQRHVQTATSVYANGTWGEIVRYNMAEIPSLVPLHLSVALRTFALFLLGAVAWRVGWLRQPEQHRRLLTSIAIVGLTIGTSMSLLDAPALVSRWSFLAPAISALMTLSSVVLAIGYGASIVALYTFTAASRGLGVLAPLGRMAFSNYLAQSLIFGWIFFGYGLGLFGHVGTAEAMLLGIVVYVAQTVISHWWLKRFRFGPMEWLWRTLMYGTRQPWQVTR